MTINIEQKRINVTLPISILEELKTIVPKRQRNQFIVDAIEREMRQLKLKKALKTSAGAWMSKDHPELATSTQIETYIREMRLGYAPRTWDEIIEADQNE